MIFLTVGTQFPFDRLVKAVDETVRKNGLDEQIFAQVDFCPGWRYNVSSEELRSSFFVRENQV